MNDPRRRASPLKIPRGEARRRELLVLAAQVLLRDGLDGASMDQIAAEAGASKATLYRHFGDRQGLVVEVVQFLCDDFLTGVDRNPPPGPDLRASLYHILMQLVRVLAKPSHPDFFRLVVSGAKRVPEIGITWHEYGPLVWHAMLARAFLQQAALGRLPADFDASGYPELLFDAVFADMILRTAVLGGRPDAARQPEQYLDKLLDAVLGKVPQIAT